MTTAEKYVTAAYCAIFAIVLLYVVIIALKLQRLEREVDALANAAAREPGDDREPVHVG
jgi:CcmD family protein